MAATCLDVITSALKLGRVISLGETPEAAEAADGMVCLQSLYDQWLSAGMFGKLEDTYPTDDDTAKEGKRYFLPAGVTLTDATSEYTDECGKTRQPRDLAVYEAFDGTTRTVRLYDRTQWVSLLNLTLNDPAPLAERNRMGLAACLAVSGGFAAMFGDTATLNPDVRDMAKRFMVGLSSKQGSTQDNSGAEFF